MWFEFVLAVLTVLIIWDYVHKRRINRILKEHGFRGPLQLPLLGCAHIWVTQTPQTVFDCLRNLVRKYGKTILMCNLHESGIMTADVRLMEALLSNQQLIGKNSLYMLLESWLGTGLLLSTGRKWHSRRKIITPTFHFKILDQFTEIFDQQSFTMVKLLEKKADGKTVINMFPVVCLCALDIIAETAMGVKINAQVNPNIPYVKSVTTVAEITAIRFMRPNQRFDLSMKLTAPRTYNQLKENIKTMHDFTDKVINDRRTMLEKSIREGTFVGFDETSDTGSKVRMALLDVLLQSMVSGSALTNDEIREEVDTFMFEGHDTTTSGISHTLYLIARHPEIQEKLFSEILQVIGDDKNKPIGMRELQNLKYLECVIKESLRLYPPVPMIGRYTPEDTVIDGKVIPAGANITVMIFHALRDPDYFPDPDLFKPERFSTDSESKINPFAYVPFSAGPRNCIGQKFAVLEMKSTISKMLRHYELLPLGEPLRPVMNLILRSATGMEIGLKPRIY